jgi:hypothetical protein
MAINLDTQSLVDYPGNVKRVTLDQDSIVPMGSEGDEKIVMTVSTSAYSDNTARTAIQDIYITNFKTGWCKSSGFKGTAFALDSTKNSLEVKIDSTTSGISGGYYRITLEHDDGLSISGDVVAADMEEKIRAVADTLATEDAGYKLAYMNASVEFKSGRFWIISGSLSGYYSGANKSSVKVRASSTNDASQILGCDINTNSEDIDGVEVKEALVLTDYTTTSGTGTITISANIGAATNDCLLITDRVNSDYFQVSNVSGGTVIEFDGSKVLNNYSANEAKVQLLREQDPDSEPTFWFSTIDDIARHGIKTIVNQIDYSS